MNTPIPELRHGEGSWVVTSQDGQVYEFYDRANVEELAEKGWNVETVGQYLARINAEVRSAQRSGS